MKNLFVLIMNMIIFTGISQAQNDTMYVMKSGNVIGFYKISDVDSVIFYKPEVLANIVTDIDGNIYNTVTIGTQVWMKENLKTTKYRNGDEIGTTVPASLDITAESNPKYQWVYDNNGANLTVNYGRLYTWYAVSDPRGVCPTGWHVPLDTEWSDLGTYLGGGDIAGGKLKEAGINHWKTPNTGATNESGFTALPGGSRQYTGTFYNKEDYGFWWTATEHTAVSNAYSRSLSSDNTLFYGAQDNNKKSGFSVRCIKD